MKPINDKMKIISNGTLESCKQITCEDCGLTFEAEKALDVRYWKQGLEWPMYECPRCHKTSIDWDMAKHEIETAAKIAVLDSTAEARKRAQRWWNKLRRKREGN
jgi:hypothetical protein